MKWYREGERLFWMNAQGNDHNPSVFWAQKGISETIGKIANKFPSLSLQTQTVENSKWKLIFANMVIHGQKCLGVKGTKSNSGLFLTPPSDLHSLTSLLVNPERCSTLSSGRGMFIWTDPWPLDFDRGSESTHVHFRRIHRPQCNRIETSQQQLAALALNSATSDQEFKAFHLNTLQGFDQ